MITVSIELSAQLKTKTKTPVESIELQSPCNLQDCIRMISQDCGEEFSHFIFSEDGSLRPTFLLSVNDWQILWDDHFLLSDGDRISILSPIAGG
jgi:molybdopterin converting factor small subunit